MQTMTENQYMNLCLAQLELVLNYLFSFKIIIVLPLTMHGVFPHWKVASALEKIFSFRQILNHAGDVGEYVCGAKRRAIKMPAWLTSVIWFNWIPFAKKQTTT